MITRIVGGPYDGKVLKLDTPEFYVEDLKGLVRYRVHKLLGEERAFYLAGPMEWKIDEILEKLLEIPSEKR